jgi:DNA polymerase-1
MAVGDYSQLEQRIAAHLSLDENLVKAYAEGVDLYGLAASILFGGEASKDHPQRGLMKTGMLALQYGAGANKLAQLMIIDGHEDATKEQAQALIEQLESVFPRFFAWRQEAIEQAAYDGWAGTLGGRRRPLEFPPGWTRMRRRRSFGSMPPEEVRAGFALERQVINTACQGGAADVVAQALIATRRELRGQARLLLQVHDEILIERMEGWEPESLATFQHACEVGHGFELAVPLAFEAKEVDGWDEKSGGGARHVSSGFQKRVKEQRSEGLQSRKASGLARRRREKAKA